MRIERNPITPRPLSSSPANVSKSAARTTVTPVAARAVSSFEAARAAPKPTLAPAPPPPPPEKKKSFWDKVGDFASGVVKGVSNAASSVVKTVAGAASTVVKTVAGAASTAARAVAGVASKVAGYVVPRAADALRSLATGALNTVVGAVKNVGESLGTIGSGIGKLFKGDFGGGLKAIGSGLVKGLVQTPIDGVLMMGGRAVSAVQTMLGLEPPGRKPTADELATMKSVYGDSVDWSRVQIKTGDVGLFGTSGRAFVHGDTIYVPKASLNPDGSIPKETLVHETGHLWQHQHGGTDYMSEALWGQHLGDGYDWKKGLDEGKSFGQLNPEQQAELVSTAYAAGYFDKPSAGFHYNGVDYTAQLEAALADIKAGRSAP